MAPRSLSLKRVRSATASLSVQCVVACERSLDHLKQAELEGYGTPAIGCIDTSQTPPTWAISSTAAPRQSLPCARTRHVSCSGSPASSQLGVLRYRPIFSKLQ